jgi:hypothetical protein
MQLRGEYSVTIGGKERHFKLCTLSDNIFCQHEGIKLSEYVERVSKPVAFTQLHLIYSQALAYAKINKQPIDFTLEDVSVWFDEVGEDIFAERIMQIVEAHLSKNGLAPNQTGQPGNGTSV